MLSGPSGVCCEGFHCGQRRSVRPRLGHRCRESLAAVVAAREKFYVCSLANSILQRILSHVQVARAAGDDIESTLLRIIQADAGNFSARTRLRLMRTCQKLCGPDVLQTTAIVLSTHLEADKIMYRIFGDPKRNLPRMDIRELALPSVSPVCKALHNIREKLVDFSPEAKSWTLLAATPGAVFSDLRLRQSCRRENLQLASGLADQFEIRLAKPPYSWVEMCEPGQPDAVTQRTLQKTSEIPVECMPQLPRTIVKTHGGSPMMLVKTIKDVVPRLAKHTVISIDLLERNHAKLRQDLSQSGRGAGMVPAVYTGPEP